MENKGPKKENVKAMIADSLKKEKKTMTPARNFHPVYGKPYFDNPAEPGNSLKKNNNQYKE
jgi:hypothetical protein